MLHQVAVTTDVYIETRFIETANSFVQKPADAIIFEAKFNTELFVRELIFNFFSEQT